MGCNCGKPKCDGHCNASPAVLQINNPSECVLFHKVEIPASMGNEITIPPDPGLYKNVLLYYEATGNAYFYSSDGIPTPISYTDYTRLTNKPSINGVMLVGNKSLADLGININDATLTIKQGDTTLGTFSANASEDVEINIPGSSGAPLSFTMRYDAGTQANVLPGWYDDGPSELVMDDGANNKLYKRGFSCDFYEEPYSAQVSFINDATEEQITPQALYALLLGGADIVLNHVPLGSLWGEEWADASGYVDNLHLSRFITPDTYGEYPYVERIGFGGSATVYAHYPEVGSVLTQLGFAILGGDGGCRIAIQGIGVGDN